MTGVVAGWSIGGAFASFFGVLGVIALAGIVVNNIVQAVFQNIIYRSCLQAAGSPPPCPAHRQSVQPGF